MSCGNRRSILLHILKKPVCSECNDLFSRIKSKNLFFRFSFKLCTQYLKSSLIMIYNVHVHACIKKWNQNLPSCSCWNGITDLYRLVSKFWGGQYLLCTIAILAAETLTFKILTLNSRRIWILSRHPSLYLCKNHSNPTEQNLTRIMFPRQTRRTVSFNVLRHCCRE